MATCYVPVCTTNLQILTVICCIHRHIHHKNSIPYSQFLRLRRLCSDDSDFTSKSEEMCQFFEKSGYPVSVVKAGNHRAQQFDHNQQYKRHKKIRMTEFHSPSLSILIITQSKVSLLITLNYSKMIRDW